MPGVLPDELVPDALSDDKVGVLPWRQNHTAITALIGRSFAGTASTKAEAALHWALGPELTTFDDAVRNQAGWFCMKMALSTKGPIATTLSVRDETGSIAAVAVIQNLECAPPKSTWMDSLRETWTVASVLATCSMPRVMMTNPGVERRGTLLTTFFARLHEAHANFPHIYLAMVGTDPPMQGKGYGGTLLRAVNRVADAAGVPIYLETGPSNRSLYEHFGYSVMGEIIMQEENNKETATSSWSPASPYLAMVRQPK